ncbi:hypothetical protein GCM10008959_32850 [Deinococcus seoulensis]|uniref:Uncharacterized protein n=1 Tax=Deinococcus seoulensis TaxID=1837379 RepID=A0ABQ2RWG3_9DEIO|nr:hypothetical protein [Deinococcus seoulensis]GGR68186.1 hypothetical protein GCM10008959_32850 [Deinococcus seoulensis]
MQSPNSSFIARKPLRFGDRILQPGESVPVELGRDYRLMLRLGQITEIPQGAALAQATQAAPFPEGSAVFFVGEDGAYSLATFHLLQDAPEDVRLDLELPPGAQVALVTFADDPESTFVLPSSLLPGQPTQRLIDELSGRQEDAHLQARVAFLERLLQAVRADGELIPDDFPAADQLAQNGVTTLAGLRLLADGENGRANLMALDAIGGGRADKILAALGSPPAPEG